MFATVADTVDGWTPRHWRVAAVATVLSALAIGLPTDVIPNPVFGRSAPVTWWSYPVLVVTSALGGLLAATYVRDPDAAQQSDDERPARTGGVGGLFSLFAVGCPACNKVVVIALGTVGARRWFEPAQPLLAAASIALLIVALRARLRGAQACPVG